MMDDVVGDDERNDKDGLFTMIEVVLVVRRGDEGRDDNKAAASAVSIDTLCGNRSPTVTEVLLLPLLAEAAEVVEGVGVGEAGFQAAAAVVVVWKVIVMGEAAGGREDDDNDCTSHLMRGEERWSNDGNCKLDDD